MLVFARHAERGDNQFPKELSEIVYDPPITSGSGPTIEQTAKELTDLLKGEGIKKVRVISSKFLRCLMTAQRIVDHFAKEGLHTEEDKLIHPEICEYLRTDWFKQYPLQQLIIDTEHSKKYISYAWREQKMEEKHPFPENYVMFHHRVGRFRQKLRFPTKGECLLIVTHGFVVRELCWRMNQIPDYSAEIKYCGFAAFKHDGKKQLLLRSRL